jgi:hypothetical protein
MSREDGRRKTGVVQRVHGRVADVADLADEDRAVAGPAWEMPEVQDLGLRLSGAKVCGRRLARRRLGIAERRWQANHVRRGRFRRIRRALGRAARDEEDRQGRCDRARGFHRYGYAYHYAHRPARRLEALKAGEASERSGLADRRLRSRDPYQLCGRTALSCSGSHD